MSSSFGITLDGMLPFIDLITKDNSVVDAMEALLASTHLSSFEKEIVKICQEQFITLRNRFPGLEQPDLLDRLPLVASVDKLSEIFNKDAEGRGLYVPPSMMIQTVNKDGSVKESRVVNEDGTATVTSGGMHVVPPGAPEEFIKAQAETTKLFTDAAKTTDSSSAAEAEKKTASKKEEKIDFGKSFSKNLRGAFM